MKTVTGLWLFAASCALAGCSSNGSPTSDPATGSNEDPLRAGTTYNGSGDAKTSSPIKHVIVIIGENRTFDHVCATYKPKNGQHVDNLLSKGIINEDGTPGPNFNLAAQYTATDTATYQVAPGGKTVYSKLPPAGLGGPKAAYVPDLTTAESVENGLPDLTPRWGSTTCSKGTRRISSSGPTRMR